MAKTKKKREFVFESPRDVTLKVIENTLSTKYIAIPPAKKEVVKDSSSREESHQNINGDMEDLVEAYINVCMGP